MRDVLVGMFFPDSIKGGTERLAYFLLGGSVATVLVSVAASQFLLALAIPASLWVLARKGKRALPSYPIALPLLLFVSWTVVVALLSAEPRLNLMALKQLLPNAELSAIEINQKAFAAGRTQGK